MTFMKNYLLLIIPFSFLLSCKKHISTTSTYSHPVNPCQDMGSYNQGLSEGRLQRGILTDCDTYYPYEGWADNKECWCKGFNDGYRN